MEETGLYVELTHVIGVFGGEICSGTYANGDKVAWVSTVFGAQRVSGILKPDGDETLEAKYFDRAETNAIPCKQHVRLFLDAAYSPNHATHFQPASWHPTGA